jgi:hypothetical protein
MLVALALTAGTAALCASAPAETMVSPDLHIVAKSQVLQQKKTEGGFISTLRASAVSLGKSLVQNVTRAIAKQSPRQNHLVRCVVRNSQRAARYRTLFRLPAVDAVLHKRESLIYSLYIPEQQPLIRYRSLPQSRSASADTPLNPIIFLAGGARKLYALHYNAGYVPAVAISQGGPQRGCAAGNASFQKKQLFCFRRWPVSLRRRKIATNSRPKGASWSKFPEFAEEFVAIRLSAGAEKLPQRPAVQPPAAASYGFSAMRKWDHAAP